MTCSPALFRSATALARMMRQGTLDPVDLVETCIRRTREVDPHLNALVADRFSAAREEARQARDRLAEARSDPEARRALPPLLGVPCTVKEFIGVRGMSWTGGMAARRGQVAPEDATVVARIRAAGAIVLGVTNMAEGGLWMETRNPLFGVVNNPWDPTRTAGGSSGGDAALVAAGAVPFGLGADIGGSIRIPAALCGTVGHKPTGRRVPATGHHPPPTGEARAMLCLGPLARRVEDLLPLVRILAGPDGLDPVTAPGPQGALDDRPPDPRAWEVWPVSANSHVQARPAARRAMRRAARTLERAGARVHPENTLRLSGGVSLWSAALTAPGGPTYREILGDGDPIPLGREILRRAAGRSQHTGVPLVVCLMETALDRLPLDPHRLVARLAEERAALEHRLGPRGVILHPPYSRLAPRHRHPMLTPFHWVFTALFNALEFPSTVVPVQWSHGLPAAVQVIARRDGDALTVAVASFLERIFGGWRRADPHLR